MGKLLFEEVTYKIRAAIFRVYNTLGFGHKELVYHKALAIELKRQGLEFKEECALNVLYINQKVGTYKPDFVVGGKVLIEIKAVPFMGKDADTQMVYYLKGTGYKLGLLVNFGTNKLDIRRKVWTDYPRESVINLR